MTVASTAPDRPDVRSWVRATTLGWWLGFGLVILLALALEVIGGVGGAQFVVGVGMGAGVGYVQGRPLNRWLDTRYEWFLASTIGMGAPFVVWDVAGAVGWHVPYSLAAYVAIGSLLVGLLQWHVLRRHSKRAMWWVPVCVLGWLLPVAMIAVNDRRLVSGVVGTVTALTGMLLGGVVLGAVTGVQLERVLRPAG